MVEHIFYNSNLDGTVRNVTITQSYPYGLSIIIRTSLEAIAKR